MNSSPYRESEPLPDPPKVVDHMALAKKHARNATIWAGISLAFATLNAVIQLIILWLKYHR